MDAERGKAHPVYYVIWHRVLAGAYLDLEQAQQRLRTVDRLDLIEWLDVAQNDALKWKQCYNRVLADVEALHRHQTEPKSDEEANPLRGFIMRLPDEILKSEDPLAALLNAHRKEAPREGDGLFG